MASIVASSETSAAVQRAISGHRTDWKGSIFKLLLLLSLIISLGVLITLLLRVVSDAAPVFQERGVSFLTSNTSALPSRAGIRQGLIGSAFLMVFVVLIAFPLGIGCGVYLEEYARHESRFARFVNANIRNLAGVPAIVYGLTGLAVFVKILGDVIGPEVGGRTLMAGGLTIAIMVLPVVIITTAEALRSVPMSIREAGYGVGATKWEVIRSHVLPNAAPGILTGTVLAIARALGETAPLIMVGAMTGYFATGSGLGAQLFGRFTALPTQIFDWTKDYRPEFQDLASAAILTLIILIFLVNLTAILLRNRYERKW